MAVFCCRCKRTEELRVRDKESNEIPPGLLLTDVGVFTRIIDLDNYYHSFCQNCIQTMLREAHDYRP